MSLWTFVIGAAGGVVGGALTALGTDFIRTPFRKFFELRGDIRQKMHFFANAPSRWTSVAPNRLEAIDLNEAQSAALSKAESDFRELGTRLKSFAETEVVANKIVRSLGYKPAEAGASLIGLSNSLAIKGDTRANHVVGIEKSLKFEH